MREDLSMTDVEMFLHGQIKLLPSETREKFIIRIKKELEMLTDNIKVELFTQFANSKILTNEAESTALKEKIDEAFKSPYIQEYLHLDEEEFKLKYILAARPEKVNSGCCANFKLTFRRGS